MPENLIPPQESTPLAASAENLVENDILSERTDESFEEPQRAIDLMAEAEAMGSGKEKEYSPEKKEIVEKAQEERRELMGGVFSRVRGEVMSKWDQLPDSAKSLASNVLEMTSASTAATKAIFGKEITGEKFTPKERLMSAMMAGSTGLSYALAAYAAYSGSPEYLPLATASYGASWVLGLAKNGKKIVENLKDVAVDLGFDNAGLVLAKVGGVMENYGPSRLRERFEHA